MGKNPSANVEILKLNSLEKLKKVIKGRVVGIIARGGSAKILEERIDEFKDYNICWASMNVFEAAEGILSRIGKELSLVSDCSTVKNWHTYEPQVRMPRFKKYLEKDNNLLFISELVIQESFKRDNFFQLFQKHMGKIATIDDVFTHPKSPDAIWDAPPNSITLLLAACIAGDAKKIVMFGFDGLAPKAGETNKMLDHNCIETYYRADLEKEDRLASASTIEFGSLSTDSFFFERDWPQIWNIYKQTYENNCDIVNCSPGTMFTVIKEINYDRVHEEIKS